MYIATSRREKYSFVSDRTVRRVWAEVTRTPHATTEEMAQRVGKAKSTVHVALLMLRDAGYINFPNKSYRARTVIVPFVVQEME